MDEKGKKGGAPEGNKKAAKNNLKQTNVNEYYVPKGWMPIIT